jgi:hypothetical protein
MRHSSSIAAALGVLSLAACDIDVTDLNNPGLGSITNNPTRGSVTTAATGLLIGARTGWTATNGYISEMGILGRESYVLTTDDPRFTTELLIGPLDGGNGAFGGNHWVNRYANIRGANIVLDAVEKVEAFTDEEKAGIRGFAKTIQAHDLLLVINTRDTFGAPIDVNLAPTAEPAPIASKADVYARIVQLLDDGRTDLEGAGSTFAFALSEGFTGFDTPAEFIKVNRALRARVALYVGDNQGALTALAESFLDPDAPMSLGVYHSFSNSSGDITNTVFDPTGRAIRGHPSFQRDAQRRPGGSLDLRAETKQRTTEPLTVQDITSDKLVTVYTSNLSPIPIIRNEELLLIRAEANINLGNFAAAVADLNRVRTVSGGLAPYGGAQTREALIDELAYNRRYSLYFEGHRWIDARRLNKLGTLPRDLPTHRVFTQFPFPREECLPRPDAPPDACSLVEGIP